MSKSNKSFNLIANSTIAALLLSVLGFAVPATASTSSLEGNWQSVASSTDGTKLVAVARGGKIYVSNDSGSTWSARESSRDWRAVASSADGTKLVAVTNDDGVTMENIYVSNDAGNSWSAKAVNGPWTSVASSADGTKLVATTSGGQIFVSDDSGDNWSAKALNGPWTSVASSADGTKLVATRWSSQKIYESDDSGLTWEEHDGTFPLDWSDVASSADGEKVIAAGDGQIYVASSRSTDSPFKLNYDRIPNQPGNEGDFGRGGNWKSVASSSDGTSLIAVEYGGQIWVSKDAGQSWVAKETNRNWNSVASSADGTKLVAVVENGAIYVSGNSGDTWTTGVREALVLGDSVCDLAIDGVAEGTADKPYLIGSAKQLAEINDCNDGNTYRYYRQTADIDLTPTSDGSQDGWNDTRATGDVANQYSTGGWVPIGDLGGNSSLFANRSFVGSYDGNYKSVTGMTINRSYSYQGLFGSTNTAEIKNLTIGSDATDQSYISMGGSGSNYYQGVVAGEAYYTNFKDVHVKNVDISGKAQYYVGGIAGYAEYSNATDVSYVGNITATTGRLDITGGIFGYSDYTNIKRAVVEGNITCDYDNGDGWSKGNNCGGIVGDFEYGSLSQVRFTGDVAASQNAGGIIGSGYSASIDSAEFNGHVYGSYGTGNSVNADNIGGICGYCEYGAIQNVVSNGDVIIDTSSNENAYSVGGIVGYTDYSSVTNALVKGNVAISGTSSKNVKYIGGAVGYGEYSGIFDVEVTGNVTVIDGRYIGGILGYGDYGASVSRSSFSGDLNSNYRDTNSSNTYAGGAIGYAEYGVQLTSTSVTKDASVSAAAPLTDVGGLIGYAASGISISDSYNRAPVAGYDRVGGIVGNEADLAVSIYNTYNTGNVTADASAYNQDVFAAGGYFKEGLSLSNTFDIESTGATTSATGVVGNSTAAMKTKSTFEALGFDFSSSSPNWAIDAGVNDGYPYLIETAGDTPAPVAPAPVAASAPVVAAAAATPLAPVIASDVFKLNKFSINSSKISKANKVKLAAYAATLKAGGYSKVTVRAFTKSQNTYLANRRALAVANLLKKYGVKVTIVREGATRSSTDLNNQVRVIGKKG